MDIVSKTLQDLLTDFLTFLPNLIAALLIFVVSLYLAGLIAKLVRRSLEGRKADNEIMLLLTKLSRWSIIILGSIAALQQVGFDVTAFLAGVGVLGFTVGFALQDVSKNFVAGLLLLLEQPFDIGDVIEVGEYTGTVANVELRATEIYTFDGQNVLIPNADVFTSPIKNFSRYNKRRLDITIGVAYDSDLEVVRQTALDVVSQIKGVINDPAPSLIFNNLNESTIDFTVYYWIDLEIGGYLESMDAGVSGIKTVFQEKGIEMPYPTRKVILEK